MLPLAGITVVAVEQAVAAPFATRHLADLGARVIKIERPGVGDFARRYDTTVKGMASHFVWLNRSKESLTLDLKHPEAPPILRALLAGADVFVHNLAPGAMDRLGFGLAALRDDYPRLIVVEISGYGSSGPYREKKAYDLLIQCEAGLVSTTGTPENPAKAGISVADIAAGMYAYSGILTALYRRERTGVGAAFEVSLFEALGEWMGYPLYYAAYGGGAPPRTGARHATIAPYGPFATLDGREVFLGVQNEREWERFCRIVLEAPDVAGDPRFAANADRVAHQQALEATIGAVLGGLTSAQASERLERAEIATSRLNTPQDVWDHPQLAARDRWRQVDSPEGPLRALLPPVTLPGDEPRMGKIPALGEHTAAILHELGYDQAHIENLRATRAI